MKSLTAYCTFAAAAYALELGTQTQLTAEAKAETTAQANQGKKWKSGEVKTHEAFKYGKFIAKIKGDDKPGTCTAFFTFWKSQDPAWSYDKWSEIDIELVPSAHHGTLSTNIIWANEAMSPWQADRNTIADPRDTWKTYEFQWTPDWISWLYEGQEIRKVWRSDENPEIEYMTREQNLMMNFWIPNFSDWNVGFEEKDMPWYARYDYVEYWEYVPEHQWDATDGANYWHPFKKAWRDEFDTLDLTRWKVSDDWTFGVNDVTFWASQVYTEDSMLVLKMEPRDGTEGTGGGSGGSGNDGTGESGGSGNEGGGNGGGATDGTCDCTTSTQYNELQATIADLQEQLYAFQQSAGNCGQDGGSGGGTGGDGGQTGGGDGGSTGGGDGGSAGGDNGGSTGGGDNGGSTGGGDNGGSTGGGGQATDNDFTLKYHGDASGYQRDNVDYHADFNRDQTYQQSKLRFINKANGPIYINYMASSKEWPQTLKVDSGKIMDYRVQVGKSISATRFWPKYQCDENGHNCAFGESGGPAELGLICPDGGCSPPIDTKFEATFGADGGLDWYNASQVDGWTLPYDMVFDCNDGSEGAANLNCQGLNQAACPTSHDLIGAANNVDLTAFNPKFDNQYSGCYSPCAKLTYNNWYNPIASGNSPNKAPADKYCCGGAFDTLATCNYNGPVMEMEYAKVIHENCDTYAWAYDDATGLKACKSDKVTFTITFYDP